MSNKFSSKVVAVAAAAVGVVEDVVALQLLQKRTNWNAKMRKVVRSHEMKI